MPFVSVTRLKLRSLRFFPVFLFYALRSARQAQGATGYLGGWTGSEDIKGFWTATSWSDENSMRGFRNSGAHLHAMRRLLEWCDEASFVRWEQPSVDMPDPGTAHRRLGEHGRLSKVAHPSPRHLAGRTVDTSLPRVGAVLHPRAHPAP